MRHYLSFAILVSAVLMPSFVYGADIEAGKKKSRLCVNCHGSAGISRSPIYPNLAGQKALYLKKQLEAYKSGSREDAIMPTFAKMLSQEDIENLSAYYASLK